MIYREYLPDYEPVAPRARRAGIALMAASLLAWLAVGFDVADLRLLRRLLAGDEIAEGLAGVHRFTGGAVFLLQLGALVAGTVTFLDWLYQSRINLRALGARRLDYTRGWALGAFFVPVLNLVRPYRVVREVWLASDPDCTDPFAWKRRRVSPIVALWWLAFVAYGLLETLGVGLTLAADRELDKLRVARGVATAADVAAAASASLAYFVVARITEAQRRKRARTGDPAPAQDAGALPFAAAGAAE